MKNKHTYEECKAQVRFILSERDCLEGVMEECSELIKACSKIIRARGVNKNWTPVKEYEAWMNLEEEITDILCYMEVLGVEVKQPKDCEKWERWAGRVTNRCDGDTHF